MIVAIHQPHYMPWLGYFNKIASADTFVLLDDVQYKKNEFQNRNKIKTSSGTQWLTVPVKYKYPEKIFEVAINNNYPWQRKHLQALRTHYSKAPYFKQYFHFFEEILQCSWKKLSHLNNHIVKELCQLLGFNTKLYVSSELEINEDEPNTRLIKICQYFNADTYLSGKGGKNYINLKLFKEVNIQVKFQNFQHPVYQQLYGDFIPNLSIVDLLFNCGDNSVDIIMANKGEC